MPMMIVCDKMTYIPGQVVTGQVVIIGKSPQKVKGLTMRFIGRSSKLLGEVEGTKRYKKEVYFDEKVDIFGHDGSSTLLRVGETLYPFNFPLPPGLPSSFEWPDGNVLYFVEAKLTRASWKDKRVSSRIQVEGVFDLNLEPMVLSPVEVKRQKYVQHLLSKSGPYGFTFKCSRSGFVLGHSLPFSVEIRNLSKVDSRKLRISLLQEVKLGNGKSVASLVEQMKGPPVTSGEVVTWEARLKVPGGIPPTNLGNVLSYPVVIHVLYFLHVQLSLKNCREDPICVKIPVTIGTISVHRQRALSVPSLDEASNNRLYPLSNNGHRFDCPMSQLILPSAAISTSQFSPHLVSSTSFTHSHHHVNRGNNNNLYPHHTIARSNRTQPVQMFGPVRQYEYYFEYEDSNGSTRSVATRGNTLLQRRRNQNNLGHSRGGGGRHFVPYAANAYPAIESPPPSYDEIFTRDQIIANTSGNNINPNVNDNGHEQRLINSGNNLRQEVAHKTIIEQDSSEEDNSSLALNEDDGSIISSSSSSSNCSGSVTPSCVTEDDGASPCEDVVSTHEDFLSCSGSRSSSCEELKCDDDDEDEDDEDDLQNNAKHEQTYRYDEQRQTSQVKSYPSAKRHTINSEAAAAAQNRCGVNSDTYECSACNECSIKMNTICDSDEDDN